MKKILLIIAMAVVGISAQAHLLWKVSGNGLKKPRYIFGAHQYAPLTVLDSVPQIGQVQNDVDAHAVGENWRGAGAGAASMLMLAVGTGIGAAFCLDGAVWRGAHHMAGEVGSLCVRFNDGLPEQGSSEAPAVFEANAAGPAIAQIYRQLGGRAEVRRGQDVMELAKAGDQTADRAIHGLGRRVGRVLGWLVLALDPEVVVLGGGVPTPRTSWWTGLTDELHAGLPQILREVPVKRATQRNNAALLGAGRDAFRLAGVATAE